MEEIWKDIDGFEGLYQVSSHGRIRSLNRYVKGSHGSLREVKSRYIKGCVQNNGYRSINLCMKNRKHPMVIHRIVAKAFLQNSQNLSDVNHIDGNKMNNRVDNLEYISHRENIIHYNRSRGTSSNHPGVCWNKKASRWQSYLRVNKRITHVGVFKDKDAAIAALNAAFLRYGIPNRYASND